MRFEKRRISFDVQVEKGFLSHAEAVARYEEILSETGHVAWWIFPSDDPEIKELS